MIVSFYAYCSEISMSVVEFPPHIEIYKNQVSGLAKNYIDDVFKDHPEFRIKWIKIPFDRIKILLTENKIDAFLTLIYNEERKSFAKYTSKALIESSPGVCYLSTNKIKDVNDKFSFEGKKIAVVSGSPLPNSLKFSNAKIKSIKNNYVSRMLGLLEKNRVEGIFHPETLTFLVANASRPNTLNLECQDFMGMKNDIRIAFRKNIDDQIFKKFDDYLVEKLNKKSYQDYIREHINNYKRQ